MDDVVKERERRLIQIDGEKIRLILSELVRKVRPNLPVGSKGPSNMARLRSGWSPITIPLRS